MAIDFPASPSTNDIHQVGNQIWFWNATYWELKSNVTKFSSQNAAPSSPIAGDVWYETDTGKLFIRYDSYWVEIGHGSDGQSFIVSETTPASTTTGDIWYESDTGKTFIYYDSYWVEIGHASDADVSAYAPLASPTLTGTPLAPTASANTSSTQIATTAFVMTEVGDYAPLASPELTGTPLAPTASANTSTTQLATTAFVMTEVGDYLTTATASSTYAPKASPEFTGNVTMQSLDMDTIVAGDVIYGSGADTLARLAKGSNDEVLTLASGVPSWAAASAGGASWSGSTANGIGTYGSSSSIVAESTATYNGATGILELTADGGGLKLDNLDSTNANTLDDYEEGTFTMAVTCGGGSVTMTSSEDTCAYIKIGSAVHIQGWISLSAISSPSSWIRITGLPFTARALTESADHAFIGLQFHGVASDTAGVPYAHVKPNETQIRVNAGSGTAVDYTIADSLSASATFIIGGTYYA